jgi:hypothetical protein
MYKAVRNSTELQYLIELGAQRLMLVHPRPPTVSMAECLRILRDKANAWSSFELNVTKRLRVPWFFDPKSIIITHQQLSLSTSDQRGDVMSKVIDLRFCTPETANVPPCIWNKDNVNPVPGTRFYSSFLDETQDLVIAVYYRLDVDPYTSDSIIYQINFRTISTDEEHPLAHGSCVKLTCRVPPDEGQQFHNIAVTVLGDRLAFYSGITIFLAGDDEFYPYWSLHVCNWCEGGQSDVGVSFDLLI